MKMDRMIIQVPRRLKTKLDAERKRGTTAAGLIRHLLQKHFQQTAKYLPHHNQGEVHADSNH